MARPSVQGDVYRSGKTFPYGDGCELTAADFPDEEQAFNWTAHYEEESRQRRNPDVTDDIIEELLSDPTYIRQSKRDWEYDRFLLQKRIEVGEREYEWTLVIADDEEHPETTARWTIITVYSNYHGSVGSTNAYFDRYEKRKQQEESSGTKYDV
jgi:hypothetical protein